MLEVIRPSGNAEREGEKTSRKVRIGNRFCGVVNAYARANEVLKHEHVVVTSAVAYVAFSLVFHANYVVVTKTKSTKNGAVLENRPGNKALGIVF